MHREQIHKAVFNLLLKTRDGAVHAHEKATVAALGAVAAPPHAQPASAGPSLGREVAVAAAAVASTSVPAASAGAGPPGALSAAGPPQPSSQPVSAVPAAPRIVIGIW